MSRTPTRQDDERVLTLLAHMRCGTPAGIAAPIVRMTLQQAAQTYAAVRAADIAHDPTAKDFWDA